MSLIGRRPCDLVKCLIGVAAAAVGQVGRASVTSLHKPPKPLEHASSGDAPGRAQTVITVLLRDGVASDAHIVGAPFSGACARTGAEDG